MAVFENIVQLHMQGRVADAERGYRDLIGEKTGNAEVYANLASICLDSGRMEEAVGLLRSAIQLKPDFPQAHSRLGLAFYRQNNFAGAIESLENAVRLKPDFLAALVNLGLIYNSAGKPDEAIESFRRALAVNPNFVEAHGKLAMALCGQGKLDEAIASCRQAIELKPDFHQAYTLLAAIFKDQGRIDEAIAAYGRALQLRPDDAEARSGLIYDLSFSQRLPQDEILRIARDFERAAVRRPSVPFPRRSIRKNGRLKIGFISAEIGNHAVSYFLESYLRNINREKFHVTLYSTMYRPESRHGVLMALADEGRDLSGISDDAARAQIIADGVDILVDTTSHMNGSKLRMLAQRCAPIQCHWIGFNGSTGVNAVDYFIGDTEVTPPEFDAHFSEKVIRLPTLWSVYSPPADAPPADAQSFGDEITFGCFNNLSKVREQTLGLWGDVLAALPTSRLLLKDRLCSDAYTRERITAALKAKCVAAERLTFLPPVPNWNEHMRLYNTVDVALDTFPLNGGFTSFDALFMGTPIVAMRGAWMGGRMTAALLKALGHPEWIAADAGDYVQIHKTLAARRQKLRDDKRELRAQFLASPLCNGASQAAELETAFERMVDAHNARSESR